MRGIHELNGETRVVGVIGWPVRHSLSPAMQNAAIAQLGLNWIYVPFEVSPTRLPEAIEGMRALGIVGLNVTVPHKEGVADLVDELGETARALGAANTVRNQDGRLIGYNTDGDGFLRSLREADETIAGKRVVLLGAGGSARSVAYAVARNGCASLAVVNRTVARAQELAARIGELTGAAIEAVDLASGRSQECVRDAQVIIDSTPQGMHPNCDVEPVVPAEWLSEGQLVCDLVYIPRDTCLLQAARRRGARTLDGTGMLVHQGAIALELWTGAAAPVETMRRVLHEALDARQRAG